MINKTDNELVRLIASGCQNAFEEIVRRYSKKVEVYMKRRARFSRDQDLLIDDVFLDLWKGAKTFKEESKFSTWLFMLCQNVMLGAYRFSRRKIRADGHSWINLDDLKEVLSIEIEDPTPLSDFELQEKITRILSNMSDLRRDIIIEYYADNKRLIDIAKERGIKYTALKCRARRAQVEFIEKWKLQEEECQAA